MLYKLYLRCGRMFFFYKLLKTINKDILCFYLIYFTRMIYELA